MPIRIFLMTLVAVLAVSVPASAIAQTRQAWVYCEFNQSGDSLHISPAINVTVPNNAQWKQSARAAVAPTWRARLLASGLDLDAIEERYALMDEAGRYVPKCYAEETEEAALYWINARRQVFSHRPVTQVDWQS
jgi:hypothetical protein